jgi:hypothetical protein
VEKSAAEQQQPEIPPRPLFGGGGWVREWVGGGFEYKLLQDTASAAFHIATKQRQVIDSLNYVSTA